MAARSAARARRVLAWSQRAWAVSTAARARPRNARRLPGSCAVSACVMSTSRAQCTFVKLGRASRTSQGEGIVVVVTPGAELVVVTTGTDVVVAVSPGPVVDVVVA